MSVIWQWTPNWRNPMIERLEWLTDVHRSKNLTEQAMQLRNRPRISWEFEVTVHARARRSFEAAIFAHQAGEWLLPIWPDGGFLVSALAAGNTAIPVETANTDFHAGGQAVLIAADGHAAEAVTVDTVSADQITLLAGTTRDYAIGARLYPARTAEFSGPVQAITHITGELATARYRLRLTDPRDHSAASASTYRGLPVLETRPNWRGNRSASYRRELQTLDYGASLPYVEDIGTRAELVQSHLWTLGSRDDIAALRAWLYAVAGRQGAFWLPTWMNDLKPVQPIGVTDTHIDVENIGYSTYLAGQRDRRDIEIELRDGTLLRRRIDSASALDANSERLLIDAALGQAVAVADVVRVSYLQTARQEADAAELSWKTGSLLEAAQELRVVNDDA